MKYAVSFLKSKFSPLETVVKIESSTADYIHVDIMDGVFVSESTNDVDWYVELLKNHIKPLDIHLMMNYQNAREAILKLKDLKPDCIMVHVEIPEVGELLSLIQSFGIKSGLAINPDTSLEALNPYLDQIQQILVMSVYPGKGGQSFLIETIERCRNISSLKQQGKFNGLIAIDGGINDQTLGGIKNVVDLVVSGSYICMQDDYENALQVLKKI